MFSIKMKNKTIFWIDNSLVYFGLAKFIQEKIDGEFFAIYDVTDRPKEFFQKQNLVKFKNIWYYHDHISPQKKPDLNYLVSFEKKYKINLWLLAYNERILYEFNKFYRFSTDEVLSILEQECKLFENILDQTNPDFLIMYIPVFHHDDLFYRMCKIRNVKCLILRISRFGGRQCIISSEDESFPFIPDSASIQKRTLEELQKLRNDYNQYDRNKEEKITKQNRFALISAALQYFFFSKNSNISTHYSYYGRTKFRVLYKTIISSLKTKYRKRFIDKNFSRIIPSTEPFIFFPLHMEEEFSLLLLAPFYTNQFEVIKQIVKALPIGYKLILKEHQMAFLRDWRSVSEYKKLMALPNVILIHPDIRPEEILKKCSLVITISGTAALDVAFYNKPSIVFVNTPFTNLDCVHKLKSVEELPEAIRTSLLKKVNISDLSDYVNYIEKISFKFDLSKFWRAHQVYFQYAGFLADVDIPIKKMTNFLEIHREEFEELAAEHVKKILQLKENNL